VVASKPGIYRLPGHQLGVVALPYLSPGWLMQRVAEFGASPEEQVVGLAGRLALLVEWLSGQAAKEHRSERVPLVFAGHVLVKGAKLTDSLEFETGYHRDVWIEPRHLPQYTSYNALGHIHLCQEVPGAGKPSWYSGAPDRVDQGERAYMPRVLLVTVPDEPGGVAVVEPIALRACTPFVFEELVGPDGVDAFCTRVAGSDPLGVVTISGAPVASRGLVEAQVRRAAERVRVQWPLEQVVLSRPSRERPDYRDAPATFRAYLTDAIPDDQARRDKLEQAFATVWSELVEERR
jgi:DNA repair exonuclease SbcCD nuclease subunit